MSTRYCQLHLVGYNDELDPSCPQCMLANITPPPDHPSKEAAIAARDAVRAQNASRATRA